MKSQWKLAVVGALLCFASSVVEAAQYFAPRYTVMDSGQIQPSLAVRFNGGQPCVIKAQLHGAAGSGKILVLGWPEGNSVGLCTFQNSVELCAVQTDFPSWQGRFVGVRVWETGHWKDPSGRTFRYWRR